MELDPADVVELEAVRESALRAGFGTTGLTPIRPPCGDRITPPKGAPEPRPAGCA